ncbi:hypothetical protein SAMD00019534_013370, partial [Acytostelium subglobosum LB1]|uniref:hypothetical protein n=1 Tax=Acytostelium subglobosum LB1 TaxID=1410327 RepID=UPI00064516DE
YNIEMKTLFKELHDVEYSIRNDIVSLSHASVLTEIQALHHSIKDGLDKLNKLIKSLTILHRKLNLEATKKIRDKFQQQQTKELLDGGSNISQQSRLYKESNNEDVVKSSTNITSAMKRSRNILSSHVAISTHILSEINDASRVLDKTLNQAREYGSRTTESKSLLTKLKRRDLIDKYLIYFGVLVFMLVVLYIVKVRLGNRFLGFFFATPPPPNAAAL